VFVVSSPVKYVAAINSQLRKGAWLQRSFTLSIETHSLPALARCYPHSFTFYVAYPIRSILNFFPSLGRVHRGGDAFPFRRQAGKIVGQSGEIAIDRSGMAARRVSSRIFQRRG